jgi:Icc-related predicted phosphoesterase
MRILAVADVHSPRFLQNFTDSLKDLTSPDIFLMAGDMINRGTVEEFPRLIDLIDEHLGDDFPIIACYGNEEYSEVRDSLVSLSGERVQFLDEISTILEIDGKKIGIVGTQGSLDRPTTWQKRNLPNIRQVFSRRATRAFNLLTKLKNKVDYRILLMHYSPCLETCEGEDTRAFSWLGSRKFYKIIKDAQPDLVIHGHVHNSVVHMARLGSSLIRNVSLPAVKSVTDLTLWE